MVGQVASGSDVSWAVTLASQFENPAIEAGLHLGDHWEGLCAGSCAEEQEAGARRSRSWWLRGVCTIRLR